MKDFMII